MRLTDRPTVVIKLSGSAVDDPVARAGLWTDSARAAKSVDLVVVHGGGKAVDRRLTQLGMATEKRDGLRVTPPDQLAEIVGVLAGQTHRSVVGALSAAGIAAIGMGPCDAGLCVCEQIPGLGRVGRVVDGDGSVISTLHASGFVPVLHSIGADAAGQPLNVNADEIAVGVARVIGASRLVLLGDVAGVLDERGELVPELGPDAVHALRNRGTIRDGMLPKIQAALAAAEAGVEAVIGTWSDATALLSSASIGAGTRVVALRRPAPVI